MSSIGKIPRSRNRARRGGGSDSGGSKFRKFTGGGGPGDGGGGRGRSYDNYARSWDYDPRRRGHDRQDRPDDSAMRSPSWHMPYHPDADERPKSTGSAGRTEEMDSNQRTPSRRDRPISEDRNADRSRSESDRRSLRNEEIWEHQHNLDNPNESFSNQAPKELKPIPEFQHMGKHSPEKMVVYPLQSHHQYFPEVQEDVVDLKVMVVIDEGNPSRQLDEQQATMVQGRLTRKLLKAVKEGTSVQFETQEYDGKFLRFTCANSETTEWLTTAVAGIKKLWEGALLAVVNEKDLPSFSRVTTFIPNLDATQETCQNALAVQNPKLNIHKWVLLEFRKNKESKGFDVVFGVPEDLIPKIQSVKGKAYYMFSKIILNIASDTEKS